MKLIINRITKRPTDSIAARNTRKAIIGFVCWHLMIWMIRQMNSAGYAVNIPICGSSGITPISGGIRIEARHRAKYALAMTDGIASAISGCRLWNVSSASISIVVERQSCGSDRPLRVSRTHQLMVRSGFVITILARSFSSRCSWLLAQSSPQKCTRLRVVMAINLDPKKTVRFVPMRVIREQGHA